MLQIDVPNIPLRQFSAPPSLVQIELWIATVDRIIDSAPKISSLTLVLLLNSYILVRFRRQYLLVIWLLLRCPLLLVELFIFAIVLILLAGQGICVTSLALLHHTSGILVPRNACTSSATIGVSDNNLLLLTFWFIINDLAVISTFWSLFNN